jgi:ABC-type phosphate/phosphonate transport system substrate-binding protein
MTDDAGRRTGAARLAALPMYDLPELAPHHDALWTAVADALWSEDVEAIPSGLDRTVAYDATWIAPNLLLGQSCGLPIIDQLEGRVTVLGAFSVDSGGADATYSSALVVHRDRDCRALADLAWPDVRVAINGWDSLSGYVSLGAAAAAAALVGCHSVTVTGAHVASAAAIADGSVDLACIDGHTLRLLAAHRPDAVAALRVIGRGPTIPCLPLITAGATDRRTVRALRAALATVAATPALRWAREALGITGFVEFGNDRYEPVRALRVAAQTFFAAARS